MIRALIRDDPVKQYREDDSIISDMDDLTGFQISGQGTFDSAHP